jgi:SAM-dependent methyltransferase
VPAPLFDHRLRALRRDRAARRGVETFLYDRAFDDCVERLSEVRGRFEDVLLAGCPKPAWPGQIGSAKVQIIDPGSLFAQSAGGRQADLETLPFEANSFDLCISVGLLDTANDLALAAATLHLALKPGGLLLGAVAGGHSLPRLRAAMLAADAIDGRTSPHVHPRIEAASLAQLLTSAGFAEPVVDVDRVDVGYSSLDGLVRDLRAMGATNILTGRSHEFFGRQAFEAARQAFLGGCDRVVERFEILHFAAWKPA